MKTIKYIPYILSLFFLTGVISCTDFDDLNSDPTKSTDMDPNLQIPTVQLLPTNQTDNWHRFFIYPGGFMNQWTNEWATVNYGGRGVKNDAYFSLYWEMYYPDIIKNVVDLVERTREDAEYTNIHAMAKILKVQNFLRLTDMYGDIPYFDAGMGYYTQTLKPAYDKQEDIYMDFFKELDEAAALLNSNSPRATSDLYYDGDVEKWKKLANSLRLRIAMRLVKVDVDKARTEAQAAVAGGVFTSNADVCFVQHDNVKEAVNASGGNGVANILLKDIRSSQFRLSTELIGTMENTGDPRILYYASSYLEDNVRTDITQQLYNHYGFYAAITVGAQLYNYDQECYLQSPVTPITIDVSGQPVDVERVLQFMQPSKVITNYGSPYIHVSYAEVEFLLAEAVTRGFITGDAKEHYRKGLIAAVDQWSIFGVSVPANAATTFANRNPLVDANALEQINTQLWILHFLDPVESWSNWRRSGYPAAQMKFYNYDPTINQSNGQTPRRIPYPLDEQKNNYDEWKQAVDRLGGTDDWTSRMWWDKQ